MRATLLQPLCLSFRFWFARPEHCSVHRQRLQTIEFASYDTDNDIPTAVGNNAKRFRELLLINASRHFPETPSIQLLDAFDTRPIIPPVFHI